MNRRTILQYCRKNLNSIVIESSAHLMALMAAIRGLQVYKEVRMQILAVLFPFILLLCIRKIISSYKRWISVIYVLIQAAMVTLLYLIAPFADYWALLLFPACVYVMRRFSKLAGYGFVLLFMANISIMISIAEKAAAIEFVPIYIVGYLLISSFSLVLRQTTIAKENAEELSRKLSEANIQLREFTERAARLAIMEERTAIARDLHDSATQTLFSANLLLGSLEQNYKLEEKELRTDIDKISKLTQTAMIQLRSLIKELKPSNAPGRNFYTDLNSFIRELKENHSFTVHYKKGNDQLPIIYRDGLLYIIREALHNSMKHSDSAEADLTIEKTGGYWLITVQDRGRGFDTSNITARKGYGLENMSTRGLQLGGDFSIESSPGEGTLLTVRLVTTEESPNE